MRARQVSDADAPAVPASRSAVYGLTVDSTIPLPGLPVGVDEPVDVVIRDGRCPETLEGGRKAHSRLEIAPGACLLNVPELGRVLVRDDGHIVLDCPDGTPLAHRTTLALGSGLGTFLHMNGGVPLHGAAVASGDGATLLLGRRGSGKSTLAAGVLLAGGGVLGDDVIPARLEEVDGDVRVVLRPAHRRFKLSPEVPGALGLGANKSESVYPGSSKVAWPVPTEALHPGPLPVIRCVILGPARSESDRTWLKPLSATAALHRLRRHVYRPGLARALDRTAEVFRLAHALATTCRIEVARLPDLNRFPSIAHYAEQVLADLGDT